MKNHYQHNFEEWNYKSHFATSQQYYLMCFDSTQYYKSAYDTTEAYLNRLHLSQFLERKVGSSSKIRAGLELDLQSMKRKLPDNAKISRAWATVYGDYVFLYANLRIGGTISEKEIYPTFKLSNII